MPKFYILDGMIKAGQALPISGEDAKHIAKSLRMKPNDTLTICDGQGKNYRGMILDVDKEYVTVDILEQIKIDNESDLKIRLFLGLTKGDKIEYAIQKCVELGIYEIYPMLTDHTSVKYSTSALVNKNERWNKIAYEAAKQSGRSIIPQIHMPNTFDHCLTQIDKDQVSLMAYLGEDRLTLKGFLDTTPKSKMINIWIGPEGGFSKEEDRKARKEKITTLHLGPRILKSETAAIFTVGATMLNWGDLDKTPCSI